MNTNEIVIYQPDNTVTQFEVRIEDETVWLTQAQMAELFQTTRNNVTLHIGNIFKEKELKEPSVCKDSLLTANDGKKYKTKCYNLDVIISVGYRVKSLRGTQPNEVSSAKLISNLGQSGIKRLSAQRVCFTSKGGAVRAEIMGP